ncbi:uncharacterized protein [Nicotiana tomentosiformis]|uniref:uncharacterized protein n=1 Tax=Nicotiana tomentosiformis TaxID=4098 RepID=UPI00388CCD6C
MAEFFRHLVGIMSERSEINFEKMRKMGGVEFEGTTDPTVAEQWLERMERVFEQLECTNASKFKYVISLLQKDAYDWWVSVPNAKAKPLVLTWDDFVKAFHAKYIPPVYCDAKKKEFLNLRQGISVALTWEKIGKEEASRRENKFRKGNSDYGCPSKKGKFDYSKTKSCGKNHYGACIRAYGACFYCGSLDHKVKDCPNTNPLSSTHTEGSVQKPVTTHSQANSGARPRNMQVAGLSGANQGSGSRATARVYAMRQKNDQDVPGVVVGKFHLFGTFVVTLFDLGSSHSYVCSSLAFPDTIKFVRLDFDVLVDLVQFHSSN